nr:condensation domain-containing protein [Chitinophaga sp. GbtcB8]
MGEIKNVLLQHADIKETVLIAETDAGGNKYLVAYLVAQRSLDLAAVKEHAGKHLPDYMIPGCFVCLDALPLSSNGKIDMKALPAPGEAAFTGVQYLAPRNVTEEMLVTIWQEVLGKPRIGVKDNFFETGGHSLNATRVISRVAQQLNVKLALRDLFVHPTIEALAALVSNTVNNYAQAITAAAARQYYPVSHAQKRLWLLEQAAEGLTAFNITRALKISGWLDTAALTKAFNHLLERHEILRTRFAEVQGVPVQQVQEPVTTAIPVKDLRTENDRELLLNMLLAEAANHSFDLANEQLIQCTLFRLEDRQHVLLINLHHIITDGWSLEVLTKEWLALYHHYTTGAPHNLAPLTLQYKDYAVWHNQELSGSRAAQLQAYWWEQFNELPPVLVLPTKQRPAVKTYNGNDLTFEIDSTLVKALQPIMRQFNSSLFTGLLTTVKILLYRVTAQEDITIGSVHAGREDAALEQQVGLYANTLALRTLLQGSDSFVQVLEKVQETMLGAYEHQAYPFDRLVSDLQLGRDESRHPLFEVYADLLNIAVVDVQQNQPDALQITELEAGGATSKYDLSFRFYDAGETITTILEYNTDLFEAHTITQIRDTFLELLTVLVRQPEQPIAAITLADSNNGGTDPTALEEAFDFSF